MREDGWQRWPDIGAAPDRVRGRGEGLRIGVRPGGGGAAGGVHLPQGGGSTGPSSRSSRRAPASGWSGGRGTSELLARLRREADAPAADVMFGGGVDSLEAYQDCFSPLLLCPVGRGWTRPCARRRDCGLPSPPCRWCHHNTKLVVPGQITGWRDLFSGMAGAHRLLQIPVCPAPPSPG